MLIFVGIIKWLIIIALFELRLKLRFFLSMLFLNSQC